MDQTKSNFYESQILEAIETVAKGIVSTLKFDQTILCTITNDQKRENGIYEVTDGSSTFTACSTDTTYKKDTVVQVLVPQGDYENQKTIVGKYVDTSASAINYIPVSESIIEIVTFNKNIDSSGWRVQWDNDKEWTLLANKEAGGELVRPTQKTIFEKNWDNTNIYSCASIKAKFKTDLSQYLITQGSYGLVLVLQGYKIDDEGQIKTAQEEYVFDCSQMYGDPYNYNIYFEHDIVFDLTQSLNEMKINKIKLDFYQTNDFKDINNNLIPSEYTVGEKTSTYKDNLFITDVEFSFGYNPGEIHEEGIRIYTPNDLKYSSRTDSKKMLLKWFTKNENVSSSAMYGVIDEMDEVKENDDFSVYWYKYAINNNPSDPILGKTYWEIIPEAIYNDKKYVHKKEPDTDKELEELDFILLEDDNGRYCIKSDAENGENINIRKTDNSEEIKKGYVILMDEKRHSDEQKYSVEILTEKVYDTYPNTLSNPFEYTFYPDGLLRSEQVKTVLKRHSYEEKLTADEDDVFVDRVSFIDSYDFYESNSLEFKNSNPASENLAEVDLIREMRLHCNDNSEGVYMIYNETTGKIADANKTDNILWVYFDNYSTIGIPKEQENCKITWKIPKNSMVEPVNFTLNNITRNVIHTKPDGTTENKISVVPLQDEVESNTAESTNIIWDSESAGYYTCSYYWTRDCDSSDDTIDIGFKLPMHYGLKPFYNRGGNNTIICEIEKYGRIYTKEINMVFGSAGINGTKYTLTIEMEKEYGIEDTPSSTPTSNSRVDYLTAKTTVETPGWPWVKVIATLYDEHFKDISEGKSFKWSWFNEASGIELYGAENETRECFVRLTGNSGASNVFSLSKYYGVLQVSVSEKWLDQNSTFTNYLSIGVRNYPEIKQYIGAEKIIYSASGQLSTDESFQEVHRLEIDTTDFTDESQKLLYEANYWKLILIDSDNAIDPQYYYAPTFENNSDIESVKTTITDEDGTVVVFDSKSNNILKPKDLYFKDIAEQRMTIVAYNKVLVGGEVSTLRLLYAQPLIYTQNRYSSSMLNNWDGKQIIDSEGNKILSALIGAGEKDSQNRFSGVFMGTIEDVGAEEKTGLLGFNEGIHTFGFHTDGTAFIGAGGKGQIKFDGTESTIQSGNYVENFSGTKIDLDDGFVEINPDKSILYKIPYNDGYDNWDNENKNYPFEEQFFEDNPIAGVIINTKDEPHFQVEGYRIERNAAGQAQYEDIDGELYLKFESVPLIKVGKNEYFLQSYNFKDGGVSYTSEEGTDNIIPTVTMGQGMKIDLKDGLITGYDFKLIAGSEKEDGNYCFIISSNSDLDGDNNFIENPLTIGSNFYIEWDGSLHANNGSFSGNIAATSGQIGGWEIANNAIYTKDFGDITTGDSGIDTFTTETGAAIIAPGGVNLEGSNFQKEVYGPLYNEDGTVQKDPSSGKVIYGYSDEDSKFTNKQIVFSIGPNFAIDKDGFLYVNNASIGGYMTSDDLSNSSDELKDVINGVSDELGEKITDMGDAFEEQIGEMEESFGEQIDEMEESFGEQIDEIKNTFSDSEKEIKKNIFNVNLKTQGAISNLGELAGQSVFLAQTYSDQEMSLQEGYYNEPNQTFYGKKTSYNTDDEISLMNGSYYYDVLTKTVYKYENGGFIEIDPDAEDIDLDEDIEIEDTGYLMYEKLYSKQSYTVDIETVFDPTPGVVYFDIYTSRAYLADRDSDGTDFFRLATEEDNITLFAVSSEGLLTASNAVISGTIYATNGWFSGGITASQGEIGDWTIGEDKKLMGKAILNPNTEYEKLLSTTYLHGVSKNDDFNTDDYFDNVNVGIFPFKETTVGDDSFAVKVASSNEILSDEDEGVTITQYETNFYTNWIKIDKCPYDSSYSSTNLSWVRDTLFEVTLSGFQSYASELQVDVNYGERDGYWAFQVLGTFVSGSYYYPNASITGLSYSWVYDKTVTLQVDKYTDVNEAYKVVYNKSTINTTDYQSLQYKNLATIIGVYQTEMFNNSDVVKYLWAPSFSIKGELLDEIEIYKMINGKNVLLDTLYDLNLGGKFQILRNGNIQISPGALQIFHGNYYEGGLINIDFNESIYSGFEDYLGAYKYYPSVLSVSMPDNKYWKMLTASGPVFGEEEEINVLGFVFLEKNDYGTIDKEMGFIIDENANIYGSNLGSDASWWNCLYIDKISTPTAYFPIINQNRGGFHLNSNESSDIFWPNALYTYNTAYCTEGSETYSHYVGFLRSVGETSPNLSNVFLGCKQINNYALNFPETTDWTNNSSYNFYIRFDGKAKFESFHTKKYASGNFAIRPNLSTEDRGSIKYYLGSQTFPWDKIYVNEIICLSDTNEIDYSEFTLKATALEIGDGNCEISGDSITLGNGTADYGSTYLSINNGETTIDSSGFIGSYCVECDQLSAKEMYVGVENGSTIDCWTDGDLRIEFKDLGEYCRIISYSKGFSTSSTSIDEQACKGRLKALIRLKPYSSSYSNYYRPLFSLEGGASGRSWDFGINPRNETNKYDTDSSKSGTQEVDELFLYGFSSSAYNATDVKNTNPSFSLGFGRKWATKDASNVTVISGYSYIAPRTPIKLGTSGYRWEEIWCEQNSLNSPSDIRLKSLADENHINQLLVMYNNIKPIAYKLKNLKSGDKHDRIHVGLSAQNVEQELLNASLTPMDFAGLGIDQTDDPYFEDGKVYSLKYGEFHGLHVLKNQEQDKRILELEKKVQQLEQEILNLRGKGV